MRTDVTVFALRLHLMYNANMKNKKNVTMRLSPEAIEVIKDIAKKLGLSQAAVVEIAVRTLAKVELVQ